MAQRLKGVTSVGDGLPLRNTNRTFVSKYILFSEEMINNWRDKWTNPGNYDTNFNGLSNIVSSEKTRVQAWSALMVSAPSSRFDNHTDLDSNGQIQSTITSGASVSGLYNMADTRRLVAYCYEAFMTQNYTNLGVVFDECFYQSAEPLMQMYSDQEGTPGNAFDIKRQQINPGYIYNDNFGLNTGTSFRYWDQERYVSDGNMIGASDKLCLLAYMVLMAQDAIGQGVIASKPHPANGGITLTDSQQLDYIKECFYRNAMFLARESEYNESRYVVNSSTVRDVLNSLSIDITAYDISDNFYPFTEYSHKTSDNVQRRQITNHRFFMNNLNASMLTPVAIAAWWFDDAYMKRLCGLYAEEWLAFGVDEEFNPPELRRCSTSRNPWTGFYYTSRTIGQINFFGYLEALHDRKTDILDTSVTYGLHYANDTTPEYRNGVTKNYLNVTQKLLEYIDGTKNFYEQDGTITANSLISWIDPALSTSTPGYVLQDAGQYILFNYYYNDSGIDDMITRNASTSWNAYRYDIGEPSSYGTAGANPDGLTYRLGPKEMFMPFMDFYNLRSYVNIFELNDVTPPSDGLPLANLNRTGVSDNLFYSDEMLNQFIQFWNNTANFDYDANGQTNVMQDEKDRINDWAIDFLDTQLDEATFDNHGDLNAVYTNQIPSSLKTPTNVGGFYNNGQQRVVWCKAYKARMESNWSLLGDVFDWCYDQCNLRLFQMRSDQEGVIGNSLDLARQEIMGSDFNRNDGFGLNSSGNPYWIQEEYRTEQNMISMSIKVFSLLYCAMLAKDGIGQTGFNVTNASFKLKFIKETCFRNAYFMARETEHSLLRYLPERDVIGGNLDNTTYNPSSTTYLNEYSHRDNTNTQIKRVFNYQAWISNISGTMAASSAVCAYMITGGDTYLKDSYKLFAKDFLMYNTTENYDIPELRRSQSGRNPYTGLYYHSVTMLVIDYMIIMEALHERTTELRDYSPTYGLVYTNQTTAVFQNRQSVNYRTYHTVHDDYINTSSPTYKEYYEHNGNINSNTLIGLRDPSFSSSSQQNLLQDFTYFAYADYIWNDTKIRSTYERTNEFSAYPWNLPNPTSYGIAGDNPRGDRQTYRMGVNETDSPLMNYAKLRQYVNIFQAQ